MEFAKKIQPQLTELLYNEGIELNEAKEIGKKMALIGQAFLDVKLEIDCKAIEKVTGEVLRALPFNSFGGGL